jgi:hypothetical protein
MRIKRIVVKTMIFVKVRHCVSGLKGQLSLAQGK